LLLRPGDVRRKLTNPQTAVFACPPALPNASAMSAMSAMSGRGRFLKYECSMQWAVQLDFEAAAGATYAHAQDLVAMLRARAAGSTRQFLCVPDDTTAFRRIFKFENAGTGGAGASDRFTRIVALTSGGRRPLPLRRPRSPEPAPHAALAAASAAAAVELGLGVGSADADQADVAAGPSIRRRLAGGVAAAARGALLGGFFTADLFRNTALTRDPGLRKRMLLQRELLVQR
jgi:hypothetical protein